MRSASNGTSIAYDDVGSGEPALLFLPGWCCDRSVFRKLIPTCSAERRVLSLDWRGHGESGPSPADFGHDGLVEDALAVIAASGASRVVPVSSAHAGWVAIEIRRRFGDRVPGIVFLDWIVTEPPPAFLDVLRGMQAPDRWRQTVDLAFAVWIHGVTDPDVIRFVEGNMDAFGPDMWARAAREIGIACSRERSPMEALSKIRPPVAALHAYSQPKDDEFLAVQEKFSAANPWFRAQRLAGKSHFPMLEMPRETALAIERFVRTEAETLAAGRP